jgi:hypothetical protein
MRLVPVATKGDGDCAFHAIFGKSNGTQYVCAEVKALRKELAHFIKSIPPTHSAWPSIEEAIQELIRGNTKNLDKEVFRRITTLQAGYDKENENFGDLTDLEIRKEYAKIIRTPGNWLLPCELSIIAHAFNKKIIHFEAHGKPPEYVIREKYNPSQQQAVNVYFNGSDHYKAMELKSVDTLKGEDTHGAKGLKNTLHGNIYQLKLLMLFLQRGYKEGYEFRLATEMEAAQKFDDLVFHYKAPKESVYKYRYLQAKHRLEGCKVISATDLLPNKGVKGKKDFDLRKYFISYQRIKEDEVFKDGELGEFCICTNIGFDFNETKDAQREFKLIGAFEKVIETDVILQASIPNAVKYKFKQDGQKGYAFPGKDELYEKLKGSSNMAELARALFSIPIQGKIDFRKLPFCENKWLVKDNVIDEGTKTLTNDFLNRKNLSARAAKLRELYEQGNNAIDKSITNEDIDEFLQHLVFAVNQPKEEVLGQIIEKELGREFNLIESKFVYTELLNATLDWMKDKKGTFLTADSVKVFLAGIQHKLHHLALVGPTLEYQKKLEKFNIIFKPFLDIEVFLKGQEQVMIYHVSNSLRLGSIQIYQTLTALGYKEDDSYVFIRLKTALRLDSIIRSSFVGEKDELLVLSCDERIERPEAQKLIRHLWSNLSTAKNKKIIFVTAKDHNKQSLIKLANNPHLKPNTTSISFKSLDKNFQEELQAYTVNFQGKETPLIELVNLEDIIDSEVLDELIKHDKIMIGKALTTNKIYIDREFSQSVQIKVACLQKNTQDVFAISGEISKEALQHIIGKAGVVKFFEEREAIEKEKATEEEGYKDKLSRYIILEANRDFSAQLQDLYKLHAGDAVHHLKWEADKFIWQQSHGSMAGLRPYAQPNKADILQNQYAVIAAEPGMGKSTDLIALANKLHRGKTTCWIIQINLLEVENKLKEANFSDIKNVVEFFMQGETTLAKKIFAHQLNYSGEIAILLDGFDEIQLPSQDKVMQLLELLEKAKTKHVFVATRPHMRQKLEDSLSVFAHTLIPFNEENRYEFFEKFWQKALTSSESNEEPSPLNKEKVRAYASKLIKLFKESTKDEKDEFIGIPLQAELLATAFLEDFKKDYEEGSSPNLPNKLPLYILYQRFIEVKYKVFLNKDRNLKTLDKLPIIEAPLFDGLEQQHQYLAFNSLFPNMVVKGEPKIKIHEAFIREVGIVQVTPGNPPQFYHRTFAEYFAAEFLVKGLLYPSEYPNHQRYRAFLIRHISKNFNYVIRNFIDSSVKYHNNKLLQHTWESICASSLLSTNSPMFFIDNLEKKNLSTSTQSGNLEVIWENAKRDIEVMVFGWVNNLHKVLCDIENFCQAVLNIFDIEKLEKSINFLQQIWISKDVKSWKVKERVQEELEKIFLHYIKLCNDNGKVFNKDLANHCNKFKIQGVNLVELINISCNYLADKQEGEKVELNSIRKIARVWIKGNRFNLLRLLCNIFPQAGLTEEEITTTFLENLPQSEEMIYGIGNQQTKSPWLAYEGKNIVNIFNVLTSKMAEEFISILNTSQPDYLQYYTSAHARNIWQNCLLPLLDKINLIQNDENMMVLVKMYLKYMDFLFKNSKNFSFKFTSSSLHNLLGLLEIALNRIISNKDLSNCIDQLYLLNKIGLQIINTGKLLLISDPNSDFEHELQLTHKEFIQELLLFKANPANSREAFEQEGAQLLTSLSNHSRDTRIFAEPVHKKQKTDSPAPTPHGNKQKDSASLQGLTLKRSAPEESAEAMPKQEVASIAQSYSNKRVKKEEAVVTSAP